MGSVVVCIFEGLVEMSEVVGHGVILEVDC